MPLMNSLRKLLWAHTSNIHETIRKGAYDEFARTYGKASKQYKDWIYSQVEGDLNRQIYERGTLDNLNHYLEAVKRMPEHKLEATRFLTGVLWSHLQYNSNRSALRPEESKRVAYNAAQIIKVLVKPGSEIELQLTNSEREALKKARQDQFKLEVTKPSSFLRR